MNHHRNSPDPRNPNPGPKPDPAFDLALQHALDQKPTPAIPADFASRVAQLAAAQAPPRATPWLGWGPRLALVSGAFVTAAMFVLAPHAAPSLTDLHFDAELLLFAELGALVLFSHRLLQRD